MKTFFRLLLILLPALPAFAVNPPGTNLVLMPLGRYSNSPPFYLGTWTNNPMGWEGFSVMNNDFLFMLQRTAGITNGRVLAEAVIGLPDAQTNALLLSPSRQAFATNSFGAAYGSTNALPWAITNFAALTCSLNDGSALLWSTNGTNWVPVNGAIPARLGLTRLALTDKAHANAEPTIFAIPMPSAVSNLVVSVMQRPDLFGRTNSAFGQRLQLDSPQCPSDAANKSYVDALYQTTAWWSAGADVQLNGHSLNLSGTWSACTVSATNYDALRITHLGLDSMVLREPAPMAITNALVGLDGTGTTCQVTIATNGVGASPRLQLSHTLTPATWQWMTNAPVLVGTSYVFTFPFPYQDTGFFLAMQPSSSPGVALFSGLLQLPSRTITNSTDTTWGCGDGVMCSDSNYLYRADGTNHWRRIAWTTF